MPWGGDRGYRRSSRNINQPLCRKPIFDLAAVLKAPRLRKKIGGSSDSLMAWCSRIVGGRFGYG
jgi:hypothetical protein